MEKKTYRNVFAECGYTEEEIEKRVEDTFYEIFYGENKFYCEGEAETGYLVDTGNLDARTEGMSYGMMMCVQLDKKKEFDRIWKWAKTYMYHPEGENKGYFAWSVGLDGTKNSDGSAPDGEEFFAMALFFASHRWGDGEGIFHYSKEARDLLHECLHKGEDGKGGAAMWDPDNKLIRFVPGIGFTDPSYHLPHFYELFALWANEEDRSFWKEAAQASRTYLQKACHPVTGLSPEYSYYDGTPYEKMQDIFGRHDWHYSDAYRTIANIGLDYEWFGEGKHDWHCDIANKLQRFFEETVKDNDRAVYSIEGEILEPKALHPVAITATNAQASLAADGEYAKQCVEKFWNTPLRTGERRYYDNCLYMFAMLALSGKYRIW
ncbi:glycosyl hydrolase family 8 [[Clostridium] polysaccharolyticum]|uniref:Oligosaccharide reducing-end xylanase n=1 Tax=[Clostridium] polysaccharolyticum TaxID=29364 RepID=A0A1H9ZQF1_9FIRM|nr:glycosyl hydrolase family 8 [[Clostridium] polysaccharolyticum]SES83050.1 oligosaccharide reducing-end xylanase [[Clostridium] polysaccharolyticum]